MVQSQQKQDGHQQAEITEQELEQKLRDLGEEHKKINEELNHYLDDMDYKPSYALDRMLESIDQKYFDPRSNEAKALRKLLIEIGVAEKGKYELTNMKKKYWFKLDGDEYRHKQKLSKVIQNE